ncbi:hypothetical protein KPH14_004814 [Odynerus spinipes]|uniref:Rab3 GTPase-activating protein catalytic subunit n=1 Tax=Odynerus spinipes TaxID=1348599 RepID=A0AAD9RMK6_9HYME|nr:hypothetical protein KPH14_004814 [Odynerus spinipes]
MNNVEIEDFYHHDFTTATEWEVFIARLEEIMHEWKISDKRNGSPLKSGDLVNCQWETKVEKVNFADVEFSFKHFKLKLESDDNAESPLEDEDDEKTECQKDIFNSSNDFARLDQEHLEIAPFFGIREFLVVVPGKKHTIINETRMKILLSSITIAANNTNSEVPFFVQVQESWQKMYFGTSVGRGSCVNFEMVHLKKIPPHCKYLTGLLAVFKQKITEGCGVRLDPVLVSVRFSYLLRDWTCSTWTQQPPDFDFMQGETLGVAELGKLPFGATFDPIGELHLYTTWPQMSENVVVDSEGFTDLEPQLAPEWSVQVTMVPSPACLLGDYLTDFLHLCNDQRAMADLLGTTKKPKKVEGPISEEVLMPIIYFLFPDTEGSPKTPYSDMSTYYEEKQWKGVKTCVIDSLVWRLAVVAAHCTHNLGGAAALAQLWYEFVQEIRFRREADILIPG